jgi:hypothetical protein
MTDAIQGRCPLLPPDPFATDTTVHVQTVVPADRALLPPDPFAPKTTPHIDYAHLGKTMAASGAVPSRLDAVRDAYSGPYQLYGQSVSVPPQFRVNGGPSQKLFFAVNPPDQRTAEGFKASLTPRGREVFDTLAHAGVQNPAGVMLGYGGPAALVKATQALYFAGKMPQLPPPATLSDCVRKMQLDNGIGVASSDYAMHALAGVKGCSLAHLGATPGIDPFGPDGSQCPRSFTRSSVLAARPGDVMTLQQSGHVGERAVVRDRSTLVPGSPACTALLMTWGRPAGLFFMGNGPFHAYAVDGCSAAGGYRKETWVFDEDSKSWLSFNPREGRATVSADGPAGQSLAGTYRFQAS